MRGATAAKQQQEPGARAPQSQFAPSHRGKFARLASAEGITTTKAEQRRGPLTRLEAMVLLLSSTPCASLLSLMPLSLPLSPLLVLQ